MNMMGTLGLRWRVTAGVALGLGILIGVFGFLAWQTIDHSTDAALRVRLSMARTTATAVDDLVLHAREQLEHTASLWAFTTGSLQEQRSSLRQLFHPMGTFARILLVDQTGTVLAGEPDWEEQAPEYQRFIAELELAEILGEGRSTIRSVDAPYPGHPAIALVIVPIRDHTGQVGEALFGELHLAHMGKELVPLPRTSEAGGGAIVDNEGNVLASSLEMSDEEQSYREEHSAILRPFLKEREAGVVIHRPTGEADHVVAFAPLEALGGGVIVEEREDIVLAVPRELRRNLLIYGSLTLVIAAGGAWLHASRTTHPIQQLTRATEEIGRGELERPITIARSDEVGTLARRFELMRRDLLDARQEQERWEAELERRVEERTQQVRDLLNKVITAQEDERKRLARELHDEVTQDLATLLVGLRAQANSAGGDGTQGPDIVRRSADRLEEAIKAMRTLMLDLRPTALDDLGLPAALRSYAQQRAEDARVEMDFQVRGEQRSLGSAREVAVFRMLQEAIRNAVRHSNAARLAVHLAFQEGQLDAVVEDDGTGFDVSSVSRPDPQGRGWGLMGMRERASLLGGRMSLRSSPGAGTAVELEVPYREEQDGEDASSPRG